MQNNLAIKKSITDQIANGSIRINSTKEFEWSTQRISKTRITGPLSILQGVYDELSDANYTKTLVIHEKYKY